MKNWLIALAILIVPIAAYYTLDKLSADKTAFEAQASQNLTKPMVIKFYSPMCLDCKKLDAVTKEVMPKYADKVIYQNFDGQANDSKTKNLVQKYNITLVPTMVFVKKDGNIYKKIEGFIEKPQLERVLNEITK